MRFAVVADDLSGAAEVASLARGRGFRVELTRMQPPSADAEVWVCDTDTRNLPVVQVEERLRQVADWLIASGSPGLFKKIDSVLRGHPGLEAGVLASALTRDVWSVPGNVSLRRVVRDGQLWVEEIPLHQTAFASESGFAPQTSRVKDLWGTCAGYPQPARWVEAEDEEGLHRELRNSANGLVAGARDAFRAWPPVRNDKEKDPGIGEIAMPDSLLMVCGSKTGWPDRARLAKERNWPIVLLEDLPEKLPDTALVGFGEAPLRPPDDKALARAVAKRLRRNPLPELSVEGGATASALFREMGWERFEVLRTCERDVAAVKPEGWEGRVWIKPGSYRWPPGLLQKLGT